jgi:hypothetical protein
MKKETRIATTEGEIKTALCRDEFYGQIPLNVVVPPGYCGAASVDGIRVEISEDATEPYVVPAEGGRLGFDGNELRTSID